MGSLAKKEHTGQETGSVFSYIFIGPESDQLASLVSNYYWLTCHLLLFSKYIPKCFYFLCFRSQIISLKISFFYRLTPSIDKHIAEE